MDTEETTIYTALLISCIVIIVIITLFAVSVVRQHQKKIALIRQNMIIEISTMEKERSRIALDLHDELGLVLSVVKFQIDNVNAPEHEDQLLLENASRQVDESIEKLREISNNLMPSSLLRKGLFISIKDFVRHVEPTTSAKITFNNECKTKVPEDLSVHIYRVVKEVIHNGIKHSQASQITINCKEDTRWLTIHYFDNGTGFDIKKAVAVSTGFGLRNLKSRVEIIGGTMVSESKPGRGSAFLFKFPLNK